MSLRGESKLTRQEIRVLKYLRRNQAINPLEAWRDIGVYRLAAVIHRLRDRGYQIRTDRTPVLNRYNEECSVARYSFE